MRLSRNRLLVGLGALLMGGVPSFGLVNLELRPLTQGTGFDQIVDVGIYAVSSGDTDDMFLGMDVVLSWNGTHLALLDAIADGPHAWSFQFGFLDDSGLDGLNNSLLDGNAFFQAASFSAAMATPEGMLVATLRFVGVGGSPETVVAIEPTFGLSSITQVLAAGGADLTGTLGSASVMIVDVREFAAFQVCFTGDVGPVSPPAYSPDPELRCEAYDFDSDGDIDVFDYQVLGEVMSGSGG